MDEEVGGHRFRDPRLLEAALTHTSWQFDHPHERPVEDFERLEFLGDAVVDFVIADELYRRYGDAPEGELTERRAVIVSRPALATAGERLGLVDRARLGKAVRENDPRFGFATRLYEAVVAAVYLDGGMEAARAFVIRSLGETIDQPHRRSPKSDLQELAQKRYRTTPTYRQIERGEPTQGAPFVYEAELDGRVARGTGRSMREAQEEAAARLLEEIADER
ncbi:MAG TPA: ribonuclease III [Candidatus Limnocylindria bacterium]|nr:ribonuclease III [Candidatus Limnocylindria bacterium]